MFPYIDSGIIIHSLLEQFIFNFWDDLKVLFKLTRTLLSLLLQWQATSTECLRLLGQRKLAALVFPSIPLNRESTEIIESEYTEFGHTLIYF